MSDRREFLAAAAAAATAMVLPAQAREASGQSQVLGTAHWTVKRAGADNVKLFVWRKQVAGTARAPARARRTGRSCTTCSMDGSASRRPFTQADEPGPADVAAEIARVFELIGRAR
jgi:anaerobic selenocysteine-containing dehydrogenase